MTAEEFKATLTGYQRLPMSGQEFSGKISLIVELIPVKVNIQLNEKRK